jgi:hypothetical protein
LEESGRVLVPKQFDTALIEDALNNICSETPFRSSNQCQALLRYIVKNTLSGHEELLKERVIGMEVFGRPPDYDCGNDPIVRTRAAEVRKRLAQYYQQSNKSRLVRIVVPSGSYRATFESPQEFPPSPAPVLGAPSSDHHIAVIEGADTTVGPLYREETSKRSLSKVRAVWAAAIAVVIVILGLCGFIWKHHSSTVGQDGFQRFWEPVVKNHSPAVIYMGTNHALHYSSEFVKRYSAAQHVPADSVDSWTILPANEKVFGSELIPNKDLIGLNDVAATSRIVYMLAELHKSYSLRWGSDLGVSDLHDAPAILLGGYSNPRAVAATKNLRFTLVAGDQIIDQRHIEGPWQTHYSPDGRVISDYAAISRVLNSETGNFVVSITGIATYSNQGAAELLSDPVRMNALLSRAPVGWEHRNIQIIVNTHAIEEVPVSTSVVTVAYDNPIP